MAITYILFIAYLLCVNFCGKQSVSQMLKKHTGPTIWFHSIKLKLFKIQLTGSSLALFWFRKTVISEKSKNKSLNLLIKINLKSFNLIEWNQIVGPMCFWDICNIWETLCQGKLHIGGQRSYWNTASRKAMSRQLLWTSL